MYILKIIWELIGTMKFVCCRKIFLLVQTTRTNLLFNKHIDKVCDNVSVLARIHSVWCTSSTIRTLYPFFLNALWFVATVNKMWSHQLLEVNYSSLKLPNHEIFVLLLVSNQHNWASLLSVTVTSLLSQKQN